MMRKLLIFASGFVLAECAVLYAIQTVLFWRRYFALRQTVDDLLIRLERAEDELRILASAAIKELGGAA